MRLIASFVLCVALAGGQAFAACNAELLSIDDWSIRPVDDTTNELKVTIKSHAQKPIRMLDAQYGFRDALGGHIAAAAIDRDLKIAAGGSATMKGFWGLYTFERLLKLKREEVTPNSCVRAVLYEDGTKEEFK
ncbi:hypothetical protein [Sinorhizobium medicae]|uniref:hypothetical protein n=1 Tax=Sinorhizobium medicae TaxID=110321 RepID=UPI000FE064A5|nr:hypothetical protein [Sinorhizobium medicae]RVI99858.1 hypothetical protein CN183_27925 [Sinorhizobium medicae]